MSSRVILALVATLVILATGCTSSSVSSGKHTCILDDISCDEFNLALVDSVYNREKKPEECLSDFYNRCPDYVPFEFNLDMVEIEEEDKTGLYSSIKDKALICPCDTTLAVVDVRALDPEERNVPARASDDKPQSGSGNTVLSIPRAFVDQTPGRVDLKHNAIQFEPIEDAGSDLVVIAILDSGIDQDLIEQYGLLEEQIVPMHDFVEDESAPLFHDPIGHGTLVTSIANQVTKGGKFRYTIYKIIDSDGYTNTFLAMCAMKCALTDKRPADIINMSFGGYGPDPRYEAELSIASQEAILVASKGNDGFNTDTARHLPSDNKAVFDIGGIGQPFVIARGTDSPYTFYDPPAYHSITPLPEIRLWHNSNFSTKEPFVCAPSIIITGESGEHIAGTSFSAPYVAGSLANYLITDEISITRGPSAVNRFESALSPPVNDPDRVNIQFYPIKARN